MPDEHSSDRSSPGGTEPEAAAAARRPKLGGMRVAAPRAPSPVGPHAVRRAPAAQPAHGHPQPGATPSYGEDRIALANRVGRILALTALFAVVVLLVNSRAIVWPRSDSRLPRGIEPLLSEEAADYAQIARQLAVTGHYSTNSIKPMTLGMGYPIGGCPELTRAPVFPAIVAVLLKLGNFTDKWVLAASVLGQALCVTVLFVLGSRLYGGWTGVTVAALALLNPGVISYANGGTGSTWAAAWVACVLLALSLLQPPPRRIGVPTERTQRTDRILAAIGAPLAGAACAVAYLTEYALFLLIVPVLIYIWVVTPRERRLLAVLSAVVPFVLVLLPWVARNMVVARSPFFSLDRYAAMLLTDAHPGSTVYRTVARPGNPYVFLLTHPQAVLANLLRWSDGMVRQFPNTLGVVAIIGAALLYITPLKSDSDRTWRWLLALCILVIAATTAVEMPFTAANYVPLLPLVALLGGIAFLRLLRRLRGWQKGLTFAALAVLMVVPAWRAGGVLASAAPTRFTAANLAVMGYEAQGPMLVITDVPKLAAWYAGMPAVDLPATGPDLQAVFKADTIGPPVFFLSQNLGRWPQADRVDAYKQLLYSREPPRGMQELRLPLPGDRVFVQAPSGPAQGEGATQPTEPSPGG